MRRVLSLIVLLVLCSCSSKAPVSPLAEAGVKQFGTEAFVIFEIPADEDAPFRLTKGTPASRRLSEIFLSARRSVVKIIVGGPSSEASRNAVIQAFSENEGEVLGGLEIVFVGDLIDARKVAKVAKTHLATVHYSSLNAMLAKQEE